MQSLSKWVLKEINTSGQNGKMRKEKKKNTELLNITDGLKLQMRGGHNETDYQRYCGSRIIYGFHGELVHGHDYVLCIK